MPEPEYPVSVGKPFMIKLPEGVWFEYYAPPHPLLLAVGMKAPSSHEVAQISDAPLDIHFVTSELAMLVLVRFGDLPWWDTPLQWHQLRKQKIVPPLDAPRELAVVLVDTHTNIVLTFRHLRLPMRGARRLNAGLREQALRVPEATAQESNAWLASMRKLSAEHLINLVQGNRESSVGSSAMLDLLRKKSQ